MGHLLTMFVHGLPATQGSKRHVGHGRIIDSCKRLKAWRDEVAFAAARERTGDAPTDGPVIIHVSFFLPRPKSHFVGRAHENRKRDDAPSWPTSRPDLTKMVRAVEDAMAGIIYKDDSQVVEQVNHKFYAVTPQLTGCSIDVEEVACG